MTAIDISHLSQWVGRKETATDVLTEGPAQRLAATLDHVRAPRAGDTLPPLWHWVYFTPRAREMDLGGDGHPKLGGFMPPVPLPRRMWAGGRLTFHAPLRIGQAVTRETRITSISGKEGKQGTLIFLTLSHLISTERGVAVEEEQHIVYREPSATVMPMPFANEPAAAAWRDPVQPTPQLLFRYSAVTFNTHRIHYDLPYAKEVEGYPGLVVQGPLTATLLADALTRHAGGKLATFSFRGQAPLFADLPMHVCGQQEDDADAFSLWAEGSGGYVAMTASARLTAN